MIGSGSDLSGQSQRHDYKGFTPICSDDKHVAGFEPRVELAETGTADFHLNTEVATDYRTVKSPT